MTIAVRVILKLVVVGTTVAFETSQRFTIHTYIHTCYTLHTDTYTYTCIYINYIHTYVHSVILHIHLICIHNNVGVHFNRLIIINRQLFVAGVTVVSGQLEEKVDELSKKVTSMAQQLSELQTLLSSFARCKSCKKAEYRLSSALQGEHVADVRAPVFVKSSTSPSTVFKPSASLSTSSKPPTPLSSSLSSVPQKLLPVPVYSHATRGTNASISVLTPTSPSKPSTPASSTGNSKADDEDQVLIGASSRGVYVSKQKFDNITTHLPTNYALKLFELVFSRHEAHSGSVEGKGSELKQLDPNRIMAVYEHTTRRFKSSEDNKLSWADFKKKVDGKCRMVRNKRCTTWAGCKFQETV